MAIIGCHDSRDFKNHRLCKNCTFEKSLGECIDYRLNTMWLLMFKEG